MSADDTFHCPGCASKLNIPAHLYVEREIRERGGPSITFSAENPLSRLPLPCPHCGYAIPVEHILKRPPKGSLIADILGCALMMGILFALILYFSGGC